MVRFYAKNVFTNAHRHLNYYSQMCLCGVCSNDDNFEHKIFFRVFMNCMCTFAHLLVTISYSYRVAMLFSGRVPDKVFWFLLFFHPSSTFSIFTAVLNALVHIYLEHLQMLQLVQLPYIGKHINMWRERYRHISYVCVSNVYLVYAWCTMYILKNMECVQHKYICTRTNRL